MFGPALLPGRSCHKASLTLPGCTRLPSDTVEMACAACAGHVHKCRAFTLRNLLSGYKYVLCSFFGISFSLATSTNCSDSNCTPVAFSEKPFFFSAYQILLLPINLFIHH